MNNQQRLRLGHYCLIDGELDYGIQKQDFSSNSYEELQNYSKVIYELQPMVMLFEAVQINFRELNNEINDINRNIQSLNPGKGLIYESLIMMSKLSVKITNFITSANSFLSNSENMLKEPSERTQWNEYRNDLHKNSISYRFVYKLRNYSQHHSLPISSLKVSLDNLNDQTTLLVNMNRDKLLGCGHNWGNCKKDIETFDRVFELYPHLREYMTIIRRLFSKYIEVRNIQLEECILYFTKLDYFFGFPKHTVPVVFVGETQPNEPVPITQEAIPMENLNWILSVCNKI